MFYKHTDVDIINLQCQDTSIGVGIFHVNSKFHTSVQVEESGNNQFSPIKSNTSNIHGREPPEIQKCNNLKLQLERWFDNTLSRYSPTRFGNVIKANKCHFSYTYKLPTTSPCSGMIELN